MFFFYLIMHYWLYIQHTYSHGTEKVYFFLFIVSLSCCRSWFQSSFSYQRDGLAFESRILEYAEEFMADSITRKAPESWCCKTSPNAHSSTTVLDGWYEMFVLIGFHQMWLLHLSVVPFRGPLSHQSSARPPSLHHDPPLILKHRPSLLFTGPNFPL